MESEEPDQRKKDLERFRKFIDRHEWTFAKTMPETPHWYVNAKKLQPEDRQEFYWAVQYIRDQGVPELFRKSYYTYLYLDEYKYWSMGAPVQETFILNRAKTDQTHTPER